MPRQPSALGPRRGNAVRRPGMDTGPRGGRRGMAGAMISNKLGCGCGEGRCGEGEGGEDV
eukprot:scaffold770_cov107-Isochrysis_galbana.AAC.1